METADSFHDRIRVTVFGISERVFDDARPLDAGQHMFDLDPRPRQLLIGALFRGGQPPSACLFFSAGKFAWKKVPDPRASPRASPGPRSNPR